MALTDFEIEPLLKEFGANLVADIQHEMQQQGLGDSNLYKSLEYKVDGNEIEVTAAPYFRWAQTGRDKGKVPWNFTEILETWITSRGIRPKDGTITDFANRIKWKTIKEGSNMWRHPEQRRDVVTRPLEENLEWLENQAVTDIMRQFQI